MIVVFDTNVVVAALVAKGLCHEGFRRAVRLRFLALSPPLLDELDATLRRKFVVGPAVSAFLKAFRAHLQLVEPSPLSGPVCRDKDDDMVLATAVAAGADGIVTGDRDLLVLKAYEAIQIVSPRQFLEWLDGQPPLEIGDS